MNEKVENWQRVSIEGFLRAMTMPPGPPPTIRQRIRWKVRAARGWLAYKIAPWTQ